MENPPSIGREVKVLRLLTFTLKAMLQPSIFLCNVWGMAATLWIHDSLRNLLHTFLKQMSEQGQVPPRFLSALEAFHSIIPWIFVSPMIVALSVFGPRSLVHGGGKATLLAAAKGLFRSFKGSVAGLVYALKVVPYFAVPGVAILILTPLIDPYLTNQILVVGYYLTVTVVIVWTIHQLIPLMLLPLLCGLTDKLPHEVMQDGFRIRVEFRTALFALIASGVLCLLALNVLFERIPVLPTTGTVFQLVVVWIVLGSMANLCIVSFMNLQAK